MIPQIAQQITINKSLKACGNKDHDTMLILMYVNHFQKACMEVINLYGRNAEAEGFKPRRRKTIDTILPLAD
jgi:hypothetical protein